MKQRLRVAQIGSRGIPGHRGGVDRVIEAVAPRLVQLGHEVIVYCATWSPTHEPTYRGVELAYLYSPRRKYLDTFVRSFLATVREMFGRSDIVHFHSSPAASLAGFARLAGKKVVVTVHGREWQRRKWMLAGRWFLRLSEWSAVRVPHRTIVVGLDLKRALEARYGAKVVYIPNGVEPRTWRPPDRIREHGVGARDYLLYLGRLVPEKQCHVLIDAFRSMADRPPLKLVIAGPTWHSREYVARLEALAAGDPSIVFTGEVDEQVLEELYSNCCAYVLPSEVEGMSLALLDAMAFGACVVASDIPANADLLGGSGVLFATGSKEDLARKLREVIDDPERAEACRQAARARITDDFSWDRITGQWEQLYLSLYEAHADVPRGTPRRLTVISPNAE